MVSKWDMAEVELQVKLSDQARRPRPSPVAAAHRALCIKAAKLSTFDLCIGPSKEDLQLCFYVS